MRISLSALLLVILLAHLMTALGGAETGPAIPGWVDVKAQYGAKGDGVSDDTKAIQRAMAENVGQHSTVYLPAGTYLVTDRLDWRDTKGNALCFMTLRGAGERETVIRLKDATFTDPAKPRAVVKTNSFWQPWIGDPPAQNESGHGNKAFLNSLRDLTIDIGKGNPGAVGIDYIANNRGTIDRVTVRSSDPAGVGCIGIDMRRYGPGPALCSHLTIEGFEIGMALSCWEYSMTFEFLTLRRQRQVGILNTSNVITIRRLLSENEVPVYRGDDEASFLALVDADLKGSGAAAGRPAIDNVGALFLRRVKANGYQRLLREGGKDLEGLVQAEYTSDAPVRLPGTPGKGLDLPVQDSPTVVDGPMSSWAIASAVDPDATKALETALNSGKATVLLPHRDWSLSRTVVIPASVRHIIGTEVRLSPASNADFDDPEVPRAGLRVEGGSEPLVIEHLDLDYTSPPSAFAIENASRRPLALRHMTFGASRGAYRGMPGCGPLFLDDVITSGLEIGPGQRCWARQLNSEFFHSPLIRNRGGQLWVLGIKTEGQVTVIDTCAGGRTEVVGGLLYPLGQANVPAWTVADGHFSAAFAISGQPYIPLLQEQRGGIATTLPIEQVRRRGRGANVALLSAYAPEATAKPLESPAFQAWTPEQWAKANPQPEEHKVKALAMPTDAPLLDAPEALSRTLASAGAARDANGTYAARFFANRRAWPFFTQEAVGSRNSDGWNGPTGGAAHFDCPAEGIGFGGMGYRDDISNDSQAAALVFQPKQAGTFQISGNLKVGCENRGEPDAVMWAVARLLPPLRVRVLASGGLPHDGSVDLAGVPALQRIALAPGERLLITAFRNRYNHWYGSVLTGLRIQPIPAGPAGSKP